MSQQEDQQVQIILVVLLMPAGAFWIGKLRCEFGYVVSFSRIFMVPLNTRRQASHGEIHVKILSNPVGSQDALDVCSAHAFRDQISSHPLSCVFSSYLLEFFRLANCLFFKFCRVHLQMVV